MIEKGAVQIKRSQPLRMLVSPPMVEIHSKIIAMHSQTILRILVNVLII